MAISQDGGVDLHNQGCYISELGGGGGELLTLTPAVWFLGSTWWSATNAARWITWTLVLSSMAFLKV